MSFFELLIIGFSLQEFGSKGIPLKDGLQCVLDYASSLEKQANQETSGNLTVSDEMSEAGSMDHNTVEMRFGQIILTISVYINCKRNYNINT